jgi:hypothetical protein
MGITVRHDPSADTLARLARQIGFVTGQENQRRQLVQEGNVQTELDQGQQRIDLGREQILAQERTANANRDADFALEDLRSANDIRINEANYRQQAQVQDAQQLRETEQRALQEVFKNGSPAIQRELLANIQRERSLAAEIGQSLSPEQAAHLRDNEILPERQRIMQQYQTESQPPTTDEWMQENFVTLPSGTVVFRDPDGKMTLVERPDQSLEYLERENAQSQSEAEMKFIGQLYDSMTTESVGADGTMRKVPPSTEAVMDRWRAIQAVRSGQAASGIAPGESGGMPQQGGVAPTLEAAAQTLGIDLSQPATPEARARLQAYMAQQQGQQPQQTQPVPPQVERAAASVEQQISRGINPTAAITGAFAAMGAAREMAVPAAQMAAQLASRGVPLAQAMTIATQQVGRSAGSAMKSIGGMASDAYSAAGVPNVAGTIGLAGQAATDGFRDALGTAVSMAPGAATTTAANNIQSLVDSGRKINADAWESLGRAVAGTGEEWKFDALSRYQRQYGDIDMSRMDSIGEVESLSRLLVGVPRDDNRPLEGTQAARQREMYDFLINWKVRHSEGASSRLDRSENMQGVRPSSNDLGRLRERERAISVRLSRATNPLDIQRLNFELAAVRGRLGRAR